MKLAFHDYELKPRSGLMGVRQGALLKVTWSAGRVGFADLHPWPEFGDDPLELQLEDMVKGELSPLVERALVFARADAELRHRHRNAFLGLALPTAHRLLPRITDVSVEEVERLANLGFTHVKAKVGRDLERETERLNQLLPNSPLKWRLDFNARLAVMDFTTWWHNLPPAARASVDFVEDPCAGELNFLGPWADDWAAQPNAPVRVVKPAREDVEDVGGYPRVIFTHALDHAFGRACALWSAARHYQLHPWLNEPGGLGETEAYEPDEFSSAWPNSGPRLKPTSGPGFGFGDALAKLKWKTL